LPAVDLRFLQRVRVIDVYRLPFSIKVNRADASLAMAIAGGFGAAEGQVNFRPDRRSIYVRDARVKIAHRCECLVDIFGVDGGRQAVLDVVGDFDGALEVVAWDDSNHGAKNIFLRDSALGIDVGKYGG